MAGRKNSPNHGKWHGRKPAGARDFKKGEKRTLEAAHKGGQARKAQFARIRSLREAAEALRDAPAILAEAYPDASNGVAAVMAMFTEAQKGNPRAFRELSVLLGETVERVEVGALPTLVDDIPRAPDPTPEG